MVLDLKHKAFDSINCFRHAVDRELCQSVYDYDEEFFLNYALRNDL